MAKPGIFVIGASGKTGTATVRRLSEKYGGEFELQAGVRNPDKAQHLSSLENVRLVRAEMGSEKLRETFAGVDALCIATPSFGPIDIVAKTAASAKAAGVKIVVILGGALAGLPAADNPMGARMAEMESQVRQVGINYCFLRLHWFYDNILANAKTVKTADTFFGAVEGIQKFSQVSVEDIGKVAAGILTDWSQHVNKTYGVASEFVSNEDAAGALSSSLKKEVKYVRLSYEEFRAGAIQDGVPEALVGSTIALFKHIDAASPVITESDLGLVERITGEKPTSFQDYINSVVEVFK